MGAPLTDITIYLDGTSIEDFGGSDFRLTVNYVCDYYHQLLSGYKPPKTSRICIHLGEKRVWGKPDYFGAILSVDNEINEEHYLSLSKLDKYKYILDIIQQSIEELIVKYSWDKEVFRNAYETIIRNDFKFSISYPSKASRDRKHKGQVLIEKSELTTTLFLIIQNMDNVEKVELFKKKNWWYWDSAYEMAKNSKWVDNSTFGVSTKDKYRYGYYNIAEKKIVEHLGFNDKMF